MKKIGKWFFLLIITAFLTLSSYTLAKYTISSTYEVKTTVKTKTQKGRYTFIGTGEEVIWPTFNKCNDGLTDDEKYGVYAIQVWGAIGGYNWTYDYASGEDAQSLSYGGGDRGYVVGYVVIRTSDDIASLEFGAAIHPYGRNPGGYKGGYGGGGKDGGYGGGGASVVNWKKTEIKREGDSLLIAGGGGGGYQGGGGSSFVYNSQNSLVDSDVVGTDYFDYISTESDLYKYYHLADNVPPEGYFRGGYIVMTRLCDVADLQTAVKDKNN